MSTPRPRSAALLVLGLLSLAPTGAWAAGHERQPARESRWGITFFVTEALGFLQGLWEKEGSGADPFGAPKLNNPPPTQIAPKEAPKPPGSTT